jgi:hypothetical protein
MVQCQPGQKVLETLSQSVGGGSGARLSPQLHWEAQIRRIIVQAGLGIQGDPACLRKRDPVCLRNNTTRLVEWLSNREFLSSTLRITKKKKKKKKNSFAIRI